MAHAQEVGTRAAHARGPHTAKRVGSRHAFRKGGLLPWVAGSPNAQEVRARAAPQAEEVGAHDAGAGSARKKWGLASHL